MINVVESTCNNRVNLVYLDCDLLHTFPFTIQLTVHLQSHIRVITLRARYKIRFATAFGNILPRRQLYDKGTK